MDNVAGTALIFLLCQCFILAWAFYGVKYINNR